MDSVQDLKLLNENMKRLALNEDCEMKGSGSESWLIKAVTVGETFLKDLFCSSKHNKRIALLQKQERQNDTSQHNGDTSFESEWDESKEEMKDTSSCSFLIGDDKDRLLLSVEDARNILTMYMMLHSPLVQTNNQVDRESLLPLWILCDGKDPERTSLIGCELAHTGPSQELDNNPFIITTVLSDGPISGKADVPTLHQVLLEAHEDLASKFISSQGFARYEVVTQLTADTTLAESSESSFTAVECTWNQVKKILERPRDASCKVLICAVPGDMRFTPLEVYKELCLLKTFADSIETGEVNWMTREKTNSIQDLITNFLDEIKDGPIYKRKTGDDADDYDAQLCWKAAFDRSDLDFTERLWNILRNNATCYDDITTAFNMVISELNRGHIQPMVHSSNETTLAKEIRTLYKDPSHIFSQDYSPMTHLVEIAIDKLQRDYTNFFLAQKLTTLYSLEWFVPSVDLLTPGELIKRLRSLHCILEVSMLASQTLGLPTNNILTLIRNALEYYRNNSPDIQHTFVLPVEQTSVVNLYQTQLPSVWRLTTQCGGRGDKSSSVYQLTSRPFIESINQTTEDRPNDETDVQKVENVVASQNRGVDDTQLKQVQETEVDPGNVDEDNTPDDDDDDDDRGQEVINYQDIQVDHNSKVTSENEGKNTETDSKNEEEEEGEDEFGDLIDDEDEDEGEIEEENEGGEEEESEYMLTPAAARELMLELRDPVEVAKFVVETDDAAGFLRALRLLLHDGYISEEEAYALKDEVAAQLRNLLMLQQVELSRALFETYQPQLEEDPTEDLDGLIYNQMAQPAEYYDYANMINQDEVPYGSSQMNLYDAYQDAIEQESSQALAEIAEILAQRIARGEISPEDGAKIMSKVVQLLPDNYWGESEEGMSSVDLGLSSQTSEFIGEDEPIERYGQVEPQMENFEEELLAQGPDGLVKEIKETDINGDEDAVELEEEAEKIADELEDELLEGNKPSKTESIEINKPGADAVVKVGPSNDVIDEDVEKNWKDMSLLLDNDIPEDILRSLGIAMTKPGNKYENEMEDKVENEMKELETKAEGDDGI